MQVQNFNYTNNLRGYPSDINKLYSQQFKHKIYSTQLKTQSNIINHYINHDTFVKTTKHDQNISFTGVFPFDRCIRAFLKHRTFKTSIKGSKRPYIPLEDDLAAISKRLKLKVGKNEEIEALDINPNNSNKYIIFLHGFSQNITNNQPLYRRLKDSKFGILAIDYRGYGKNKPSFNIYERDLDKDVSSAIAYLNKKGVEEIGLVGHSFGGYLASRVSKKKNIDFQILIAPMISLEFWLRKVLKRPKTNRVELSYIKYIPGFKEEYLKVFDIKRHFNGNKTPTYLIHSSKDMYIRAAKINELAEHIPNLQNYTILKHGGHKMDDAKISAIRELLDNL